MFSVCPSVQNVLLICITVRRTRAAPSTHTELSIEAIVPVGARAVRGWRLPALATVAVALR